MCQDVDQVCAGAHSGRRGWVKKKERGGVMLFMTPCDI